MILFILNLLIIGFPMILGIDLLINQNPGFWSYLASGAALVTLVELCYKTMKYKEFKDKNGK